MTKFLDEHQGTERNLTDMDSFNDLIRALAHIDIPLGGRSFTSSNQRATPDFAKPDWCLVSKTWDDIFPYPLAKHSVTPFLIMNPFPSYFFHYPLCE